MREACKRAVKNFASGESSLGMVEFGLVLALGAVLATVPFRSLEESIADIARMVSLVLSSI